MTCMEMSMSGAETGFTRSFQEVLIPIFTRSGAHPIRTGHFRESAVVARGPATDGPAVLPFVSDSLPSRAMTISDFVLSWFRFNERRGSSRQDRLPLLVLANAGRTMIEA